MASLRTSQLHKEYSDYRKKQNSDAPCPLCVDKTIITFKYWKIIENKFPYDLIAEKHHMLVPIRHVIEDSLIEDEKKEFNFLKKNYLNENYECIMETTNKKKTVPNHFHLHLFVVKEGIEK